MHVLYCSRGWKPRWRVYQTWDRMAEMFSTFIMECKQWQQTAIKKNTKGETERKCASNGSVQEQILIQWLRRSFGDATPTVVYLKIDPPGPLLHGYKWVSLYTMFSCATRGGTLIVIQHHAEV